MLNFMKTYEGKWFFLSMFLFVGLMIQLCMIKVYLSPSSAMPALNFNKLSEKSHHPVPQNNESRHQSEITPKEQAALKTLLQQSFKEDPSSEKSLKSTTFEQSTRKLFIEPRSEKYLEKLSLSSAAMLLNNATLRAQRCFYQEQSYLAGDIVKTDAGWMRCTPDARLEKLDWTKAQS